jgi:integrase/recombinase XerC
MSKTLVDLDATVAEYVFELRQLNRAAGTIHNYCETIGIWSSWLAEQPDPPETMADVRKPHVSHFIAFRQEIESPSTALSRHRRLRAFFRWCERNEIVDKNPMATMREPSVPDHPPAVLSTEELTRIFDLTKADKTFAGIRDFAILMVLADTGCHVGELVGMALDDIDTQTGTIVVTGKGNRRRRIAFGARTGKALLVYLRHRARQKAAQGVERLWVGKRGPLTEPTVWRIVKDRGANARVDGVFPHQFRHTSPTDSG